MGGELVSCRGLIDHLETGSGRGVVMWVVGGDSGDEWEEVLLCDLVMRWDGNTNVGVELSYVVCGLDSWQQLLDREQECSPNTHSSLALCVLQGL